MQYIPKGPDIPDELLQLQEEGRVVFFCGAGISYPAGLPDFRGLVEKIYERLGTRQEPIEAQAFKSYQYDATLNILEDRLPGHRRGLQMRRALASVLKPSLRKKGATDTHAALLRLATTRDGKLRLVTTNFDRVFEHVAKRDGLTVASHVAPMLPVPKSSRWDGLIYLHGLLPKRQDDSALHRLVVTSGDFGLAYLTERWAARFVTELFRNYVVCFVGYSINDPVMRYMMDALAADRMLGEVTPQAWAVGSVSPGDEDRKTLEWKSKGVRPILYESTPGDHSLLHETLHAWANTYRDGVTGKAGIVAQYALARPSASTREDNYVGRMLWALSDRTGTPAKMFADFNPVPPLNWLFDAFLDERFRHSDLPRFAVTPSSEEDASLQFSLVHRPAPYHLAAKMSLLNTATSGSDWDAVMFNIARWLTRHLNDASMVLWIAGRVGTLGSRWVWLIERKLDELDKLDREGKHEELLAMRANAPNSIPTGPMRRIWRLIVSGSTKGHGGGIDLYDWIRKLDREGFSASLRLELRRLIAPRITFTKLFRWGENNESYETPKRIKDIVSAEVVLFSDHANSAVRDFKSEAWRKSLPFLLDDFQMLLRDALDLLAEVDESEAQSDRSYWHLPSIAPHRQNRGFSDWVTLIELVRDAWLATKETDIIRAREVARSWFANRYPTFKRLALYVAGEGGVDHPDEWVDWLLSEGGWWLFSIETKREVLMLFRTSGGGLTTNALSRLETAILAGPPRKMFIADISSDHWQHILEGSVWLRLAKLGVGGAALGEEAASRMSAIKERQPNLALSKDHRDEFSHWMSGTGDPDYQPFEFREEAPRKCKDLVEWLKQPAPERHGHREDTWGATCRNHMLNCICALRTLADQGNWPEERWREAFQVWGEQKRARRSWMFAASSVALMPDDVLSALVRQIGWWLKEVSNVALATSQEFTALCARILHIDIPANTSISQNGKPIDQPVIEALNHPVGHVVQALLHQWFKQDLGDGAGLPTDLKAILTEVCDRSITRHRHGRVILSSQVIALFRVDQQWSEQYLLPLFDWGIDEAEARAAWQGFLWSPRIYAPLMNALKRPFLETARHYSVLGDHGRQFAAFMTYLALEPTQGYTAQEFQQAFAVLPKAGLREAAQALTQATDGAGDHRAEYWKNRVAPFWQTVWPKSSSLVSPSIAEELAELAISSGNAFPEVLAAVEAWLVSLEHPYHLLSTLQESGLCGRFSEEALRLLTAVASPSAPWAADESRTCLMEIEAARPELARSLQFRRLREVGA